MLVLKTEAGQFRLVTDFAALNLYLKRMPNTSATIAQMKARIVKAVTSFIMILPIFSIRMA